MPEDGLLGLMRSAKDFVLAGRSAFMGLPPSAIDTDTAHSAFPVLPQERKYLRSKITNRRRIYRSSPGRANKMSAWSSAAGKPQLSYAERLRRATQAAAADASSAPSPAPAPAPSSGSPGLTQLKPQTSSPVSSKAASANVNSSIPAAGASSAEPVSATATATDGPQNGAQSSEESTESTLTAEKSSELAAATQSGTTATPKKAAAPVVNVWEARRKQQQEREAEVQKERAEAERRQAAERKRTETPAKAKTARHAEAAPIDSVEGSRTGSSHREAPPGQAKPDPAQSRDLISAEPSGGQASTESRNHVPKLSSGDTSRDESALPAAGGTASGPAHKSSTSSRNEMPSRDPKPANPASAVSGQESAKVASDRASSAQRSASPTTSVGGRESGRRQEASAPVSPERAPVLPRAEYDNAWLARIHLLNGGQNMPSFGAGPHSHAQGMGIAGGLRPSVPGSGLTASERAEQRAELAVAQALSAPRSEYAGSDWQPSGRSNTTEPLRQERRSRKKASAGTGAYQPMDSSMGSSRASRNGPGGRGGRSAQSSSTQSNGTRGASPIRSKARSSTSRPRRLSSAEREDKNAGQKNESFVSPPPLVDAMSWPSPMDAATACKEKDKGKDREGSSERRPVSAAVDATSENPPAAAPTDIQSSLEDLQVRLARAPGTNGKKGKQWIPIIPTITHTTPLPDRARRTLRTGGSDGKNASAHRREDRQRRVGSETASKTPANNAPAPASAAPVALDESEVKGDAKADSSPAQNSQTAPSEEVKLLPVDEQGTAAVEAELATAETAAPNAPASEGGVSDVAAQPSARRAPISSDRSELIESSRPAHLPPTPPPTLHAHYPTLQPNGFAAYPMGMWNGPASPYMPHGRPQKLNKDGSFSPTRVTDYAVMREASRGSPTNAPKRGGRGRGGARGGAPVVRGPMNYQNGPQHNVAFGRSLDRRSGGQGPATPPRSATRISVPSEPDYALGAQQPSVFYDGNLYPGAVAQPYWSQYGYPQYPAFQPYAGQVDSHAPVPMAPPAILAGPTHQLLIQIEFYFSQRNLEGDFFLRHHVSLPFLPACGQVCVDADLGPVVLLLLRWTPRDGCRSHLLRLLTACSASLWTLLSCVTRSRTAQFWTLTWRECGSASAMAGMRTCFLLIRVGRRGIRARKAATARVRPSRAIRNARVASPASALGMAD